MLKPTCLTGFAPPIACWMQPRASTGSSDWPTLTICMASSRLGAMTRACSKPASCWRRWLVSRVYSCSARWMAKLSTGSRYASVCK